MFLSFVLCCHLPYFLVIFPILLSFALYSCHLPYALVFQLSDLQVRKCLPVPWQCAPTTIAPAPTAAAAPPQPGGNEHGCIDCDITPLQRCVCAETLKLTRRGSAYLCDPHSEDRYYVAFCPFLSLLICATHTPKTGTTSLFVRLSLCLSVRPLHLTIGKLLSSYF